MFFSCGVETEKRMVVLAGVPSSRFTSCRSPMAEERLPAGVVEAVVEGNEHGHESLAEDPALVARVERLAGALFELGDDGLV